MFFDEAFHAAARRDAVMEAYLDELPICESCGEVIMDDYYYRIDGAPYCEECLNELFRREVGA